MSCITSTRLQGWLRAFACAGLLAATLLGCSSERATRATVHVPADAVADAVADGVADQGSETIADQLGDETAPLPDGASVDLIAADLCPDGGCPATAVCGDGVCVALAGETTSTCPADCHACGDGICSPGEGPQSCAKDCCGVCGDGKCIGYECLETPTSCAQDCSADCGNGVCEKSENPGNCALDCKKQVCGNHVCEPGDGGTGLCPADCGPSCGNCVCEKGEDYSTCPNDCGYCGDGTCSVCSGLGENETSCLADCGDLGQLGCTTAWQKFCKDAEPCTADACVDGKGCVHSPASGPCSDGSACTVGDTCGGGVCIPGSELGCNDGDPCTQDGCVAALGCTHNPANGAACDDGDLCTQGESCSGGACGGGLAIGCDDAQPCTDDTCEAGNCVHLPSEATCSDGDVCTVSDLCLGGQCAGGPALDCDDGSPCTQDACGLAVGCTHTALEGAACADGDACTLGDTCTGGSCTAGKALDCDDGGVCTDDACEGGACVHLPNAVTCTDDNACTAGDACLGGGCTGLDVLDCDDGNPCTEDACDPAGVTGLGLSGGCTNTNIEGTACTDGDPCTLGDACQDGNCKSGSTLACDDGSVCTDDACEDGTCVHLANNAPCSDGDACTVNEACAVGLCSGAMPVDCADANACTFDTCKPASGLCQHLALEALCDDGDACTTGDHCKAGLCAATAVDCGDSDACTVDSCEGSTGTCPHPATSCDDGNPCTVDGCDPASGCTHQLACADADPCTLDLCSAGTGACQHPPNPCDDSNSCTTDLCVAAKGCVHRIASGEQTAYLKPQDWNAGAYMGGSLAMDGDTLVVGATAETGCGPGVDPAGCGHSGAAFVFVRQQDVWVQQGYLKASAPPAAHESRSGDGFGAAVAISGDTVVVGAYAEDSNATGVDGNTADNSASNAGAAYVFVRSGNTWSQQAYLKASNTNANDRFGSRVAVSGDTVVVGASDEASNATGVGGNQADNSAPGSGAVYVFVRKADAWSQQSYLKGAGPQQAFGGAISISGDTLVVGAPTDGAGGPNSGAAYVFVRQGETWSQQALLKASNAGDYDGFGGAVTVDGDTIAVGAINECSGSARVNGDQLNNDVNYSGAAYVFVRTGDAWQQQAYIKASNPGYEDNFGGAVSLSGDSLVVGAVGESSGALGVGGDQADNSRARSGAAYLFHRQGGGWSQRAYVKALNSQAFDAFGVSVSMSGGTVAVGAYGEDGAGTGVNPYPFWTGASGSGAAYVFEAMPQGCDDGDACTTDVCVDQTGCSASVNTLSCDDKNVCTDDACNPASGCVYLANTVTCSDGDFCTMLDTCNAGSCAGVHDPCLDGNGCTDDSCQVGVGCAHSAVDCSDNNPCTTDACDSPDDTAHTCSYAVATIPPPCQDGNPCSTDDACVGSTCVGSVACNDGNACNLDLCNTATGCVSAPAAAQAAYVKASNPVKNNYFGGSTAIDGDTMVIGAPAEGSCAKGVDGSQDQGLSTPCAAESGAAYVFVRENGVWHQQAYLKASNAEAGDGFGSAVAILGDTIVVGASGEDSAALGVDGTQTDNSALESGAAYVFVRQQGVWTQQGYLKASNTDGGDRFGGAVAVSADTIAIGAAYEASAASGIGGDQSDNSVVPIPNFLGAGAVYVYARKAGAWSQQAYIKASNIPMSYCFGQAVALSGNTLASIAVLDATSPGGGAAYVFVRSNGVWSQQARLRASNPANSYNANWFGGSMALSGDTIAVGVPDDLAGIGAAQAGAVYVFVRTAAGWNQQAHLGAASPNEKDLFGKSVAVDGDTLVVGAPWESSKATGVGGDQTDNSMSLSGAAFAFVRKDAAWSQAAYLKPSNTGAWMTFGGAVAVSGATVVAGANLEGGGSAGINGSQAAGTLPNAGAAYVFGLAQSCDDGNSCTVDSCNPSVGCLHTPTTDSPGALPGCTDGDSCSTDACKAGVCSHGPAPMCSCAVEFDGGSFVIPDHNASGGQGTITLPDLGPLGAGGLIVHFALTNSDTATVRVSLIAPDASEVLLYDQKTAGTVLNLTYPPNLVATGSLSAWTGLNPQGTWTLKVVDSGLLNNTTDGTVSAWRIVPMYACP